MDMTPNIASLSDGFRLGEWMVHPRSGVFKRSGHCAHVEPKVMDVLLCLARVAGEVATREELLNSAWQGVVVTDEALTRCISELRTLLGDTGRERRYVRTVPKRGYALLALVEAPGAVSETANRPQPNARNPTAANHSIAVLPFTDMSPAHDNAYFSDGLTEELTSALTQIEQLQVASRTSTFSLKGQNADIKTIGDTLHVGHILEGSVRTVGDKLRISARLVNAEDGFQLWSESFSRELKDVFAIQEEIAGAVAGKLKRQFGVGEAQQPLPLHADIA